MSASDGEARTHGKKKLLAIITAAALVVAGGGIWYTQHTKNAAIKAACSEAVTAYDQARDANEAARAHLQEALADAKGDDAFGFAVTDVASTHFSTADAALGLDPAEPQPVGECSSQHDADAITDQAETLKANAQAMNSAADDLLTARGDHMVSAVNEAQQEAADNYAKARESAQAALKRAAGNEGFADKYGESDGADKLIKALQDALAKEPDTDIRAEATTDVDSVSQATKDLTEHTKTLSESTAALSASVDTYVAQAEAAKKAADEQAERERQAAAQRRAQSQANQNSGGQRNAGNQTRRPKPAPANPAPKPAPAPAPKPREEKWVKISCTPDPICEGRRYVLSEGDTEEAVRRLFCCDGWKYKLVEP